ncbi:hypothetical protein [Clostridium thailandense]|uniref:Uncharacterized protein n=1 Tax=Clostridium thailandense TaxID=2794346 RepID=A0A949TSM7_9CLOT|nr:hypothetical protein [Clostridium thailandense]MBV7271583.1 hypothetical protein [Clostridium thailandense]MCH5136447.1 hypothetical protein [Clostridiaceae bacterium UIB06]
MRSKDYMKKVYRNFFEFVSECSSQELEYFIFDSKFTTMFNERIGEIVEDIRKEGKKSIELAILFNTEGEIALIDSYVVGRYIGNNYNLHMEEYYKEASLNNIVKHVINGNRKSKKDFLMLSYNTLNNILNTIYSDIKFKKDTLKKYIDLYDLKHCVGDDCVLVVAVILILEDICKYLGINDDILEETINYISKKRNCQNN